MDRRDFVKLSSILTAGSTVLTSCGKGIRQVAPLAVPEDQIVLGEEKWVKSVCGGCEAACGLEVRLVDGRAVKVEGLRDHPVNAGRLCPRGQAEPQALYNPDRIRSPRSGGREVSWDQALDAAAQKLRDTPGDRIAVVTRRMSGLRADVIAAFVKALGAQHVILEPLDEHAALEANRLTWGVYGYAMPDYGEADYVLSFSAPLVESGPSPVRTQRLLGHMRQGRPGRRGKLAQADARYSRTAAYADEWLPIRPGSEGALALAIAHVILRDDLVETRAKGVDAFRKIAAAWPPEKAASITGIEASRIERIAHEFTEHTPSIAVGGGEACGHSNAVAAMVAVNALNVLVGTTVPVQPSRQSAVGGRQYDVLIAYGTNPVFECGVSAPFMISLASFPDETAEAAQVVLPDHTALERWEARGAPLSVARPAVAPLYNTRDAADTLIALAAKAGKPTPFESWEKAIAASFESRDAFRTALNAGGVWSEFPAPAGYNLAPAGVPAWESPKFVGDGLILHIYESTLGAGEHANLPWLQELPEPMVQTVWTTAAELNPQTAAQRGVRDGDRVAISSPRGRIEARAVVSPGAPPDAVVIAAGQGHTAYGRYARGRGGNPLALVEPQMWAETRVKVERV